MNEISLWANVIVASATFVVAICALVQTRSVRQSAEAAERSSKSVGENLETYKSKERARLQIDFKSSESYEQGEHYYRFDVLPPKFAGVFPETIYMEVTQHGPTGAFNVVGWGDVVFAKSKVLKMAKGRRNDFFPRRINGGYGTPIPFHINIVFDDESQLDDIQNGTLFAHLIGGINYDDIFESPHRTPFHYLWRVDYEVADDGTKVDCSDWIPWGSAEDNRAT